MKLVFRCFLILGCLSVTLSSCAQRIPEGGPCSYNTETYPAVITHIYEMDSLYSELFIIVYAYPPADIITWSGEFGGYLSKEELRLKSYKVGDTLSYQIKQIIEGSCNPYIKWLSGERYRR